LRVQCGAAGPSTAETSPAPGNDRYSSLPCGRLRESRQIGKQFLHGLFAEVRAARTCRRVVKAFLQKRSYIPSPHYMDDSEKIKLPVFWPGRYFPARMKCSLPGLRCARQ
jgi:hypothetical protein